MELEKFHELKGLRLYKNFITPAQESNLIQFIDSHQWNGLGISPNPELIRRTMQFGATFLYKTRKVESELEPLPKYFDWLFEKMDSLNVFKHEKCNHIVVNEYQAGQGIMPHTDAPLIFGKTVAVVSLLSDCLMYFYQDDVNVKTIHLPRLSLLVFEGDARYNYKHHVTKDKIETLGDLIIERSRRVSITCRTIIKIG